MEHKNTCAFDHYRSRLSLAGFVVVRILSDDTGQKRGSSILLRDDPPVRHSVPSSTHLYLHMVLSRSLLYSNRCARTPLLYPSNGLYYNAAASFHIAGVTCFQEFFRSNRFHTVLSSIVISLPKKRGESFLYIFQQQRKGRKSTGTSGVCVRHDVTSTPGSRMIGYQPRHAFPQKR